MPVVRVRSRLPCSRDMAFRDMEDPAHFVRLSKPLLTFEPLSEIPSSWKAGTVVRLRLKLFGVIPWSDHRIEMLRWESGGFETRESGGGIRYWNHRFTLMGESPNACICEDTIEFDAGAWNPLVWIFSQGLYRLRYHQWRKLRLPPS